jgi:hypothetical protein
MQIERYVQSSSKNWLIVCDIDATVTGNLWAKYISRKRIANIEILNDEVVFYKGVKKNSSKIGKLCRITLL